MLLLYAFKLEQVECLCNIQNGTFVTKREMTTMATWENESVYWGKELKGNIKKSHEKRDETLPQYIQRLLRPSASKDTKHKNSANMHHLWKLTVNKVAMGQPRCHTDQYI